MPHVTPPKRGRGRPPRLPGHQPDCHGSTECGGVFLCPGCKKLRGWCFGAYDNEPELCDACWYEKHGLEAV